MTDRSSDLPFAHMVPSGEPASRAKLLWTSLSQMQNDMNTVARSNAKLVLPASQLEVINEMLSEVIDLLAESGRSQNLRLFDLTRDITAGDALLLLGHFKGSLRGYRIGVLQESPFSF